MIGKGRNLEVNFHEACPLVPLRTPTCGRITLKALNYIKFILELNARQASPKPGLMPCMEADLKIPRPPEPFQGAWGEASKRFPCQIPSSRFVTIPDLHIT